MKLFNALSLKALMLILGALCGSATAFSQTPAQLLQSLTPAQRAALLQGTSGGDVSGGPEVNQGVRLESEALSRDQRLRDEAVEAAADPALKPRDTVIVEVDFLRSEPAQVIDRAGGPPIVIPATQAPIYTDAERQRLGDVINLVRASNPYELDDSGAIIFSGFAPISLAGLDEAQASYRLSNDPSFAKLKISLKRLPVGKSGIARLKRFGYELFKSSPSTFAPVTNIPAPADYIVGSGDQLSIQLFGAQDRNLRLVVDREGRINFPEIGPIAVAGLTFSDVRDLIEARVSEQMIGVRASTSLGDTRSIQILVMGDVGYPGAYTVSGLATVTSAIYAAGGVAETGSLRQVELKRDGVVVGRFDFYDLLLRGDTSADYGLRSGDVVFVRPVGATVAVDGAVQRPAIYEIRSGESLETAISFAGGLTDEADSTSITVVEFDTSGGRRALQLDFNQLDSKRSRLTAGAEVLVRRRSSRLDSAVFVEGHVEQPGVMKWSAGMTITDLFPSISALKPGADANYVLIRRELENQRVSLLSVDLAKLLSTENRSGNVQLQRRDTVIVFDGKVSRQQRMAPLLRELRLQSSPEEPVQIVSVGGEVRWPGEYPLEPGMRLTDLIRAGGGLSDRAFVLEAEISRQSVDAEGRRAVSRLVPVKLASALKGNIDSDAPLFSRDTLVVKPLPDSARREVVTLEGEVLFPGEYPIQRGETLRSVIERAGGLTALGFARGAVFTRESLRERESKQIDQLEASLRQELATSLLGAVQSGATVTDRSGSSQAAFGLLEQLQQTEAVGRLVINLDRVLGSGVGSRADVLLRGGDRLVVPVLPQEVSVIGEVNLATSHLYASGLTVKDYLARSGGYTDRADKSRVHVVKADGTVVSAKASWIGALKGSNQSRIEPGDTIVVPPDVAQLPPLPFWQAVTTIIYNAAVAVAAIRSF
jgi:polysaccharide export outer membrane protein